MFRIQKSKIDDVVRLSGVSRSTVDRVLNGRQGVRKETAEKVENALKELRYHESALKRRVSQSVDGVEILVSVGSNPFFHSIRMAFEAIVEDLEAIGHDVTIRSIDFYQPDTLVKGLSSLADSTKYAIIVGADTPEVTRQIDKLAEKGIKVLTVISDVPMSKRVAYVGQDNFGTGRLAGSLMSKMVRSSDCPVAVITGHLQFRHLLDRQSGFLQILGTERPDLHLIQTLPYGRDPERGREIIADLFAKHPNLGGLYVAGGGQPSVIQAISELKGPDLVVIGHELNSHTRKALLDNVYTLVLSQNIERLAEACVKFLSGKSEVTKMMCEPSIVLKENLF